MKLKYILPVATIASVATAVAPIATSCGKNSDKEWYATWTKGTEYKPMTPKSEQKIEGEEFGKRLEKLTQLYHDDIKNNPAIYSDDYVNGLYMDAKKEPIKYDIREAKHKVTEVGDLEDCEMEYYRGTKFFRISVKLMVDATLQRSGFKFEFDKRTAELKNIPVVLRFADESQHPYSGAEVMFFFEDMKLEQDDQWSMDIPEIVNNGTTLEPKLGIGSSNKVYNKSNIPTDNYIKEAFKSIAENMICVEPSNYYQNVVEEAEW